MDPFHFGTDVQALINKPPVHGTLTSMGRSEKIGAFQNFGSKCGLEKLAPEKFPPIISDAQGHKMRSCTLEDQRTTAKSGTLSETARNIQNLTKISSPGERMLAFSDTPLNNWGQNSENSKTSLFLHSATCGKDRASPGTPFMITEDKEKAIIRSDKLIEEQGSPLKFPSKLSRSKSYYADASEILELCDEESENDHIEGIAKQFIQMRPFVDQTLSPALGEFEDCGGESLAIRAI